MRDPGDQELPGLVLALPAADGSLPSHLNLPRSQFFIVKGKGKVTSPFMISKSFPNYYIL